MGLSSPQGPAMLCLWPPVFGAAGVLGSLRAVWGQRAQEASDTAATGLAAMLAQRLWSFLGSHYCFNDPKMTIDHNTVKFPLPELQGYICPISEHKDVLLSSHPKNPTSLLSALSLPVGRDTS